jgi:hypothetical protein
MLLMLDGLELEVMDTPADRIAHEGDRRIWNDDNCVLSIDADGCGCYP